MAEGSGGHVALGTLGLAQWLRSAPRSWPALYALHQLRKLGQMRQHQSFMAGQLWMGRSLVCVGLTWYSGRTCLSPDIVTSTSSRGSQSPQYDLDD